MIRWCFLIFPHSIHSLLVFKLREVLKDVVLKNVVKPLYYCFLCWYLSLFLSLTYFLLHVVLFWIHWLCARIVFQIFCPLFELYNPIYVYVNNIFLISFQLAYIWTNVYNSFELLPQNNFEILISIFKTIFICWSQRAQTFVLVYQ